MAKAKKAAASTAEYPKPLVRLKATVGGYDSEVRMVADGAAEDAAKGEGFQTVEVPEQASDFVEYPKMLYHADGGTRTVANADEEAAAAGDGYAETPPGPEEEAEPRAREPERRES